MDYIGTMDSRRTHPKRYDLLREAGVTEEHIKRLMSPIGLDMGSRTLEEIAVSVAVEIIALRTHTPAVSLRDSECSSVARAGPANSQLRSKA